MALGYITLGEDYVVALNSSDGDLGFVELQTSLIASLFRDDNSEHEHVLR
jgi:hypothetical protein